MDFSLKDLVNLGIGFILGVFSSLIASNTYVAFNIEKSIRHLFKIPTISLSPKSFVIHCKDGLFLVHSLEIENKMILTPVIPKTYLITYGNFGWDSSAYKSFLYFRNRGISWARLENTTKEIFEEFNNKIIPHNPGDSSYDVNVSKNLPIRIVILCEIVNFELHNDKRFLDNAKTLKTIGKLPDGSLVNERTFEALNHLKIIGELHAAVANPMPEIVPGAFLDLSIISEIYGQIETLHIKLPEDLEFQKPLGDTIDALKMKKRPPCLMDIGDSFLTWPLRFDIKNYKMEIKKFSRK